MKEMSDLICGKAAVGGNYNSTRDKQIIVHSFIQPVEKNADERTFIKPDEKSFVIRGDRYFFCNRINVLGYRIKADPI